MFIIRGLYGSIGCRRIVYIITLIDNNETSWRKELSAGRRFSVFKKFDLNRESGNMRYLFDVVSRNFVHVHKYAKRYYTTVIYVYLAEYRFMLISRNCWLGRTNANIIQ